ncbi:MAG: site-2 protease family protein [Omnitrophica WOR_2 bacterium]
MRASLTVGRVSGIPLKVHINWVIAAVLVTWSLAGGYFPQNYPHQVPLNYWIYGGLTAILFFMSVLFHELGHAMIAISEGVPVKSITLFIFGGVAHISKEPPTPQAEFRIVVAGPFTSLFLAGIFYVMAMSTLKHPEFSGAAYYLSIINFILATFNLIPGFPLDGGRILRSILWKWKNNFRWATRWASNVGLGLAGMFIITGIALLVTSNYFNGLWIGFMGWYLGNAARDGYRQSTLLDPSRVYPSSQQHSIFPEQTVTIGPLPENANLKPALVLADRAMRMPKDRTDLTQDQENYERK